jgi:hypothetical protein
MLIRSLMLNKISSMDELTARLESLLSRYATALDQDKGDDGKAWEHFRKELQLLRADYGPRAVYAALDKMPDGAGDFSHH